MLKESFLMMLIKKENQAHSYNILVWVSQLRIALVRVLLGLEIGFWVCMQQLVISLVILLWVCGYVVAIWIYLKLFYKQTTHTRSSKLLFPAPAWIQ